MKAYVDKDGCISCGLCTEVCPEIFKMEDDGKAGASKDEIADDLIVSAKDAEEECPVSVITVE
ncbi:ferredoxin [Clostridium estertheticum]|uniref:ferredoxin n=1 Tax=Clostridium estertheticum TaxID=238834 RepID=UPI0013E8FCED|nr:ferredoxin [Clostridium estertheticum]MBZ9685321.1 ferredoxin [Clostridium estertheticum]